MPAIRNRSLDGLLPRGRRRGPAGGRRGPGRLPPHERQPVRAGAGDLLPGGHLPLSPAAEAAGRRPRRCSPSRATCSLLNRRFEESVDEFLAAERRHGPSDTIASGLAAAYHALGFQTLADQVRRSVRSVRGNQWMFRMGHPADHPLEVRRELLRARGAGPLADPRRVVRPSAWTSRTAAGATFSSWAWTSPKARGC